MRVFVLLLIGLIVGAFYSIGADAPTDQPEVQQPKYEMNEVNVNKVLYAIASATNTAINTSTAASTFCTTGTTLIYTTVVQ